MTFGSQILSVQALGNPGIRGLLNSGGSTIPLRLRGKFATVAILLLLYMVLSRPIPCFKL